MSDDKVSVHLIRIRGKTVKYVGTKAAAERYQAGIRAHVVGNFASPGGRVRATPHPSTRR